jgi:serine/threonine protein kinase
MVTPPQLPVQPIGLFFDPTITSKLEGTKLKSGWTIIEKLRQAGVGSPGQTGSNFSIGYRAEKDGVQAFLKVYDLARALHVNRGNIMGAFSSITRIHNFECTILQVCDEARLDRIIRVLDRAEEEIPTPSGYPMPIAYIVFELADGDIRQAVNRSSLIEDVWKFEILHNVAVGLQQLHGQQIVHQDIKPSNVLTFDQLKQGVKIADLGQAIRKGVYVEHEKWNMAGDPKYAPPEQVYGFRATEWIDRRESCDFYQLGSLVSYLFAGITPNEYYCRELNKAILPAAWMGGWVGTYDEVLPHISAAFPLYIEEIQEAFPEWARTKLVEMISQMCNPDYKRRGDPKSRMQHERPLGINKYVSRFDRLRSYARIETRKHA